MAYILMPLGWQWRLVSCAEPHFATRVPLDGLGMYLHDAYSYRREADSSE